MKKFILITMAATLMAGCSTMKRTNVFPQKTKLLLKSQ